MKQGLIIEKDGACRWYLNNQLHRETGPAIERVSGFKMWYYYGEHIKCKSQKHFEKLIKLKAFW